MPWSDAQKWWMDVLKSAVTAVIGFGIAYALLDRLEQRRSERQAVCSAAIVDLRQRKDKIWNAARAYQDASKAVLNELLRWRDEQPTQPIVRWQTTAQSDLLDALLFASP